VDRREFLKGGAAALAFGLSGCAGTAIRSDERAGHPNIMLPSEMKDVSAEHPEIFNGMKAELENWQQSVIRSCRGEDYKGKR